MKRALVLAAIVLSLACQAQPVAHADHEAPTATPAPRVPHWWTVRRGDKQELGSSYRLDVVAYIVPRDDGHEDAYCYVIVMWPDVHAGGGIAPAAPQVCGR